MLKVSCGTKALMSSSVLLVRAVLEKNRAANYVFFQLINKL